MQSDRLPTCEYVHCRAVLRDVRLTLRSEIIEGDLVTGAHASLILLMERTILLRAESCT